MAIRYVEYVKMVPNPKFDTEKTSSDENPEFVRHLRDRHISEMGRSEGRTFKVDYHFEVRPDLGPQYAKRRIAEVEDLKHASSMVQQMSLGHPVFEYCEEYETEQSAKPMRLVFENHPEIVQDYVVPLVQYFLGDLYVTKEQHDKEIEELKARLTKKANAAPGRKKAAPKKKAATTEA